MKIINNRIYVDGKQTNEYVCDHCRFIVSNLREYNDLQLCSECIVIRKDIFQVIKLVSGETIKLNSYNIRGFNHIKHEHTIVIDGKEIELSEESFNELKKSLL